MGKCFRPLPGILYSNGTGYGHNHTPVTSFRPLSGILYSNSTLSRCPRPRTRFRPLPEILYSNEMEMAEFKAWKKFPSPSGDPLFKSPSFWLSCGTRWVSVPFRGSFIQIERTHQRPLQRAAVSVPFRGSFIQMTSILPTR